MNLLGARALPNLLLALLTLLVLATLPLAAARADASAPASSSHRASAAGSSGTCSSTSARRRLLRALAQRALAARRSGHRHRYRTTLRRVRAIRRQPRRDGRARRSCPAGPAPAPAASTVPAVAGPREGLAESGTGASGPNPVTSPAPDTPTPSPDPETPSASPTAAAAALPFENASVWSTPLPADAQVDPRSSALAGTLLTSVRAQMQSGTGPALSTAARAPIYTVGADVPRVPVRLDSGPWADLLEQELAKGVPIPANALPSRGSDAEMVVWQPSTDTMWEFFLMQQALHYPQFVGSATLSTGGSLGPGSYQYGVTAVNANGETTAKKPGLAKTVTTAGSRVTINWAPIEDATGYKVYRASGTGAMGYLATVPTGTTSFTDSGARQPDATPPPTSNTAATPGQWRAANAGRLHAVSTSPGYYRDIRDVGGNFLERYNWGPTATSLPLAAGMITKADLERGRIDHALAIGLPNLSASTSIIAASQWAFPAQRGDGKSTLPNAIPEGARFRLDPSLNLDSLQLSPFVRMLADAAQRYGMIVQDGAPATLIYGEDPNPYIRAGEPNFYDTLVGRQPPGVLNAFPWERLTLLKMTLCTKAALACTQAGQG